MTEAESHLVEAAFLQKYVSRCFFAPQCSDFRSMGIEGLRRRKTYTLEELGHEHITINHFTCIKIR
jgi:hypothetical protein